MAIVLMVTRFVSFICKYIKKKHSIFWYGYLTYQISLERTFFGSIGVVVYKKVSPGHKVRDLLFYGNYFYSSSASNSSSITWQADLATEVPGPKIAITPALYKKS